MSGKSDKRNGKKTKRPYNSKWRDEYLVTVYELAKEGRTELEMAKIMGISKATFILWERNNDLFKMLVDAGRSWKRRAGRTYADDRLDYIYHQLETDTKVLWQKLFRCYMEKKDAIKTRSVLEGVGRLERQKVYLCAYIRTNFNASDACRITGLNRNTVESWKGDKEYQKLLGEVREIQKDWVDDCLSSLVDQKEFAAVKFLAQALNKEKYGETDRIKVDVSGQIVQKNVLSIEDLRVEDDEGKMTPLPLNIQTLLLRAFRNVKKQGDGKESTSVNSASEETV